MLVDCLKDVLSYVYDVGSFDVINFNVKDDTVEIKTKDDKNTIIVYGKIDKDLKEMKGEVGLSKLSLLKGFVQYYDSDDNSVIKVDTYSYNDPDNEDETIEKPSKIIFNKKNQRGSKSTYKLMSDDAVNTVMKVPNFKGVTWNVTVIPESDAIEQLKYFNGIFSSFDDNCLFRTNNGNLEIHLGSGTSDSTVFDFATNIGSDTLKNTFTWSISQILSILKIYKNIGEVSMKISDAGALQITGKTGLGEYNYILVGQRI